MLFLNMNCDSSCILSGVSINITHIKCNQDEDQSPTLQETNTIHILHYIKKMLLGDFWLMPWESECLHSSEMLCGIGETLPTNAMEHH